MLRTKLFGLMDTATRRKWINIVSVVGISLGLGAGLWWLLRLKPPSSNSLQISFVGKPTKVDPYNRLPFFHKPVAFNLTSSNDCSILVWETGIQIQSPLGWKAVHEEHRNEPWRLKSGVPLQFTVEPPYAETWRAYILYGTEMKGLPLLKAQLREAWMIKSFSNWTGKPWGGGPWSGRHELFSDEVIE